MSIDALRLAQLVQFTVHRAHRDLFRQEIRQPLHELLAAPALHVRTDSLNRAGPKTLDQHQPKTTTPRHSVIARSCCHNNNGNACFWVNTQGHIAVVSIQYTGYHETFYCWQQNIPFSLVSSSPCTPNPNLE